MAGRINKQTARILAKTAQSPSACIGWRKQAGEGETVTQSMWAALILVLLVLAASFVTAQAAVLFEKNREKNTKKGPSNGGPREED